MSDNSPETIEAAAARLRMWDIGMAPSKIYGDGDPIEAANNDAWDLARAYLDRLASDRAEREERARPIDAEWLVSIGFSEAGINGWSMLLQPTHDGCAVCELFLSHDGDIGILQDDDHVVLTSIPTASKRGQLLDLLRVLKGGDA